MAGPQPTHMLTVSAPQQTILEALQRQVSCPQALAMRVRIILGAARGERNEPLAKTLGCSRPTVRTWRAHWAAAEAQLAVAEDDPATLRQTIGQVLADTTGRWAEEAEAIIRPGLPVGRGWPPTRPRPVWTARTTSATSWATPCSPGYHTRPGGTRQDVLAVLWGQELRFRLNDEAVAWLERTSLPAPLRGRLLLALPWERDLSRTAFHEQLSTAGLTPGRQQLQQVGDALAVAAYHAQSSVPIVAWLLSDDASVYDHLRDGHGLCWVSAPRPRPHVPSARTSRLSPPADPAIMERIR